jgi:hypothetical protein
MWVEERFDIKRQAIEMANLYEALVLAEKKPQNTYSM